MAYFTQIANELYRGNTEQARSLFTAKALHYGGKLSNGFKIEYGKDDQVMMGNIRANLYPFSTGKGLEEMGAIRDAMIGADGKILPFGDFQDKVKDMNLKYNRSWLRTEYNAVIRQGSTARQWADIDRNKDILPYLQYKTVNDERVREEHAALHDRILPVNDSFWDNYMPPNGWNCRCYVKQIANIVKADDAKSMGQKAKASTPPVFRNNAGKSKMVFDPASHNYYRNLPRSLDAVKTYGLRRWEQINKGDLKSVPGGGYKTTKEWFDDMKRGDVIEMPDRWGEAITFDAKAATHLKKRSDIIHLLPDTLKNADEIYEVGYKGGRRKKLVRTVEYIRYYKNKPVKAVVTDGKIKTFYEAKNIDSERKGVLTWVKR